MNTSADTQDFAVGSRLEILRVENGFTVRDTSMRECIGREWVFNSTHDLCDGIARITGDRFKSKSYWLSDPCTDKKCSCGKPFAPPTVGELLDAEREVPL